MPNPDFKVTALLNNEYLRNGTRDRHSYNEVFIRTCVPLKIELTKYSMTQYCAVLPHFISPDLGPSNSLGDPETRRLQNLGTPAT